MTFWLLCDDQDPTFVKAYSRKGAASLVSQGTSGVSPMRRMDYCAMRYNFLWIFTFYCIPIRNIIDTITSTYFNLFVILPLGLYETVKYLLSMDKSYLQHLDMWRNRKPWRRLPNCSFAVWVWVMCAFADRHYPHCSYRGISSWKNTTSHCRPMSKARSMGPKVLGIFCQ